MGLLPVLRRIAVTGALTAAAVLGMGTAAADDYTALLINPNTVLDTTAYTAGDMSMNPAGQPGVTQVYNHRDGRSITDTVWVLPDAATATAAVTQAVADSGIANPKSETVPVGTGGTYVSGMTADGATAMSLLSFTEGNAAVTIAFAGPANDPAPSAVAVELGQAQAALIKNRQGG